MIMTDKSIDPHEMVHVGMRDEQGGHGFQDALGQVVNLAAVEEAVFLKRPYPDKENRVIEETGIEGRFKITEGGAGHCLPESRASYKTISGRVLNSQVLFARMPQFASPHACHAHAPWFHPDVLHDTQLIDMKA
jgi:hypothetical protein